MRTITLLLGLSLLASTTAFAASTGNLDLSGSVALVSDIVITPNGTNNSSLNIVGGETAKVVASASETSNNLTGYTVTLSSANGGQLRHTVDPAKKTTFEVSYAGGAFAQPGTSASVVKSVSALSQLTTAVSNIRVNVTALPNAVAGTYSDTLTLAIVAN